MNKHEEKHKSDVKENEKSGEMRGFATPKQAMRGPKQGMRGKKQGIGALQKKRIPCGCTSQNPTKSTTQKVDGNKKILPFLNSYYYQNCCRADSFQHLYINNVRKMV